MVLRRLHQRTELILCEQRLQKEIFRTLVIIVFFVVAAGGMVAAQMVSDHLFERYVRKVNITEANFRVARWLEKDGIIQKLDDIEDPESYAMEPLRDIVFQILPNWSSMRGWLPDTLLLPLVGACFLVNVLWRQDKIIRYQGWIVLRRFLLILSILYVFRTITFIVTTVPSPMEDCRPVYVRTNEKNEAGALHKYLVLFGRMASGKVTACTDNIYSGHTTLITVCVWTFLQYSGAMVLRVYALLHAVIALAAILITRLHYTVDVIVAIIVASFVYMTVHYLIQFAMDEYYSPKTAQNPQNITDAVIVEKILLQRIGYIKILRIVRWIDGMDIRLGKRNIGLSESTSNIQ